VAALIDGADYIAALKYAGDQKWIEDGPSPGTLQLTQAGYAVGKQP
jgi:hypothetical protein